MIFALRFLGGEANNSCVWHMKKRVKTLLVFTDHPLVAQNYISSLLQRLSLCLPSRGWCMKVKHLPNSQSIRPKIMRATLGQSPIGWWRMLCGRSAAAENTITTLLRLCCRVSVQTSRLWCWQMEKGGQWWMLLGAALFKYTFLESRGINWVTVPTCPNRWSRPLTSASSFHL